MIPGPLPVCREGQCASSAIGPATRPATNPGNYMPDRSDTVDQPATAPLLRTVLATRYVTPFREGGSVPALVEADDYGLYVLKFRGASQGPRVLVAELLAGEIGRALGLHIPEMV